MIIMLIFKRFLLFNFFFAIIIFLAFLNYFNIYFEKIDLMTINLKKNHYFYKRNCLNYIYFDLNSFALNKKNFTII